MYHQKCSFHKLFLFQKWYFNSRRFKSLPDSVGHGAAGAVATIFHDAIMTPAEGKDQLNNLENHYFSQKIALLEFYSLYWGKMIFRGYILYAVY